MVAGMVAGIARRHPAGAGGVADTHPVAPATRPARSVKVPSPSSGPPGRLVGFQRRRGTGSGSSRRHCGDPRASGVAAGARALCTDVKVRADRA
jgi:hypothetical protein